MDSDEALDILESPDFVPGRSVLLETRSLPEPPSAEPEGSAAKVRIRVDEPERVIVDVNGSRPGYLVLNDAFYPGWRAFVDGIEVEILRANSIFRAVAVPSGATEVRFEYWPENFGLGLAVSSATATGLALIAAFSLWKRSRPE